MDIGMKVQILRACSSKKGNRCSSCPAFGHGDRNCIRNAMKDAATALSTLQAENEKLRTEKVKVIGNDELMDELQAVQDENEKLRAELRQSWTSVNNNLPAPEEEVELFCQTRFGTYTCHGFYVPDNFSEEDSDYCWDFECMSSYDEENDCYYIAPGWYERIHNWDDYGAVGINDKVTHWRPLSFPDFSKED